MESKTNETRLNDKTNVAKDNALFIKEEEKADDSDSTSKDSSMEEYEDKGDEIYVSRRVAKQAFKLTNRICRLAVNSKEQAIAELVTALVDFQLDVRAEIRVLQNRTKLAERKMYEMEQLCRKVLKRDALQSLQLQLSEKVVSVLPDANIALEKGSASSASTLQIDNIKPTADSLQQKQPSEDDDLVPEKPKCSRRLQQRRAAREAAAKEAAAKEAAGNELGTVKATIMGSLSANSNEKSSGNSTASAELQSLKSNSSDDTDFERIAIDEHLESVQNENAQQKSSTKESVKVKQHENRDNQIQSKSVKKQKKEQPSTKMTEIVCRNIDGFADAQCVAEYLLDELGIEIEEENIKLVPTKYGLQVGYIKLPEQYVTEELLSKRPRIAFNTCKLQRKEIKKRCYQCMQYGHVAENCVDKGHLDNNSKKGKK